MVTPFIGAAFILSALEYSREQLTTMTPAQMAAYRTAVVSTVRMPYLVIAGLFLAYAVVIFLSKLPEVGATDGTVKQESTGEELRDIWRYGHLVKGVIAQFFYVGAQVGVGSFVIRLAQHSVPGMLQKDASFYLKLHLIGFMIGRFSGSYIMKRVPAARLLSLFALSTSDLPARGSSRLRRGSPLGGRPDWLFSFDHVSDHLCPKHQAAWTIYKAGIVVVSGFDHRWRHFPRHNGIHLRPQHDSGGVHSSADLPGVCTLLRGARLSACSSCRIPKLLN